MVSKNTPPVLFKFFFFFWKSFNFLGIVKSILKERSSFLRPSFSLGFFDGPVCSPSRFRERRAVPSQQKPRGRIGERFPFSLAQNPGRLVRSIKFEKIGLSAGPSSPLGPAAARKSRGQRFKRGFVKRITQLSPRSRCL